MHVNATKGITCLPEVIKNTYANKKTVIIVLGLVPKTHSNVFHAKVFTTKIYSLKWNNQTSSIRICSFCGLRWSSVDSLTTCANWRFSEIHLWCFELPVTTLQRPILPPLFIQTDLHILQMASPSRFNNYPLLPAVWRFTLIHPSVNICFL